jgi:hypothetical protein
LPTFRQLGATSILSDPSIGKKLLDIDFNHLNQLDSTDFERSALQPDGAEKEQRLCLSDVLCCINNRLSTPVWQSQDSFTALNENIEQLTMCEKFSHNVLPDPITIISRRWRGPVSVQRILVTTQRAERNADARRLKRKSQLLDGRPQ